MYDDIKNDLRTAYAKKVTERDTRQIQDWKLTERDAFLEKVLQVNNPCLLEIGAGTGQDSQFFQEQKIDVTATDLSPANVQLCLDKGLNAQVMDVCDLQFAANRFDAIFSLNCLLHLPKEKFLVALEQIDRVLKSRGVFYLGLWGGYDFAGTWGGDSYEPKRFFSFYADAQLEIILKEQFEVLSFKRIAEGQDERLHFQSFLLKKP